MQCQLTQTLKSERFLVGVQKCYVVGSIDLPPAFFIAHHILKAIVRFLCTLLISKKNDGNYYLKRLSIQKMNTVSVIL
jgi:hypothetical protein